MEKISRQKFLPGMMVALAASIPLLVNCSSNPLDTLCCKDFQPGGDMLNVNWEMEGTVNGAFSAYAQAVADFSAQATASINDIAGACQNIAVALKPENGNPDNPNTKNKSGVDAMNVWCGLAVSAIGEAKASGSLKAAGQLTVTVQPPQCTVEANFQASCEGKCKVDVQCQEPKLDVRCEPGKLSGQCSAECSGTCEGSASVSAKCQGSCSAQCSGTCEGNANLAVQCTGTCTGTCEGKCNGQATPAGGQANCAGTCTGTCKGSCALEANASVQCSGKCTGGCTGSCQLEANAKVTCNGTCRGGCSVDFQAPRCEGTLQPPKCTGDVDCQASCKASASARATCQPPEIKLTFSGSIQGDVKAQAAIQVLEENLPKILAIFKGRGKAMIDSFDAVVKAEGQLSAKGKLSGKADACLIYMKLQTITVVTQLAASLKVSGEVAGSVGAS